MKIYVTILAISVLQILGATCCSAFLASSSNAAKSSLEAYYYGGRSEYENQYDAYHDERMRDDRDFGNYGRYDRFGYGHRYGSDGNGSFNDERYFGNDGHYHGAPSYIERGRGTYGRGQDYVDKFGGRHHNGGYISDFYRGYGGRYMDTGYDSDRYHSDKPMSRYNRNHPSRWYEHTGQPKRY